MSLLTRVEFAIDERIELVGILILVDMVKYHTAAVGNLIETMTYWQISAAVLAVLCGISYLFTGPLGDGVFVAAAVVGMVPVRLRARRVHLVGVLIGPVMLGE